MAGGPTSMACTYHFSSALCPLSVQHRRLDALTIVELHIYAARICLITVNPVSS